MTTTPLLLKGNLALGTTANGVADVSDGITTFKISADRDEVSIPATLATPKSARVGGVKYQIEVGYFSNDESTTGIFGLFWASLITADGLIYFSGSMRDGLVTASNPLWTGSFYVTGASLGGGAEDLSVDSRTFTMTGAPTRAIVT